MRFQVTIGKHTITLSDIVLSIVSGAFISVIILFWQFTGLIEKPLIHSPGDFLVSTLGFALFTLGFASAIETIEQTKEEFEGEGTIKTAKQL
jgi:hypothetical protein